LWLIYFLALVVKYLTGRFIWEYQSDFDWKYSYQTQIDGEEVHMEIIDSLTMDDVHMTWAEGFLVVYDITNLKTLNHLEKLKKKIELTKQNNNYAIVVVGNKTDLEHCRAVEQEYASQIASRIGASSHVMCSACGSESTIRFVFDELCREVAGLRQKTGFQKPERRRRSLAQVRQGLKMLVYTGKSKQVSPGHNKPTNNIGTNKTNTDSCSPSGSNKSSSLRKGRQNATIMSAPVINSDDHNIFLSLFHDADHKRGKEDADHAS